jgi:hypothetical protein
VKSLPTQLQELNSAGHETSQVMIVGGLSWHVSKTVQGRPPHVLLNSLQTLLSHLLLLSHGHLSLLPLTQNDCPLQFALRHSESALHFSPSIFLQLLLMQVVCAGHLGLVVSSSQNDVGLQIVFPGKQTLF